MSSSGSRRSIKSPLPTGESLFFSSQQDIKVARLTNSAGRISTLDAEVRALDPTSSSTLLAYA